MERTGAYRPSSRYEACGGGTRNVRWSNIRISPRCTAVVEPYNTLVCGRSLLAGAHWGNAVSLDISQFVVSRGVSSDSQSCTNFQCTVQPVKRFGHLPLHRPA